jgi:hypothetical protein
MGTAIAYLPSDGSGALKPQTDTRPVVQACVDVLPDETVPITNVPWRANNGEQFVPKFTHVPVSGESVCAGIIDGTQKYEIHEGCA